MSQKNPKSPKSPAVQNLEIIGKGGSGPSGKDKGDKESGGGGGIKLDDIDISQLSAISLPVKKRVNALKNEQLKLVELERQFFEELHLLECKFAKLFEPIYEKRKKIVTGEIEPTEEEAKWAFDDDDEDVKKPESKPNGEQEKKEGGNGDGGDEKKSSSAIDESKLTDSGKKLLSDLKAQFGEMVKKGDDSKGIPNFWLETLQAVRYTSDMIQEHDEAVLAYLQDIRVRMHEQKPYGFTLEFEFAENPFFTNKVLTKTYELKTQVDAKDPFSYEGPDLERVHGCKIDWKPNKNVTVRLIKKKIKGRNKKAPPKVITKEEKVESFFSFFETRDMSSMKPGGKKGDRQTSESGGEVATSPGGAKQLALKSHKNHPDEDDNIDDDDEMDEEDALNLYLMTEYETGQYFKEKIIPKAALFYSGEINDLDDEDDDYYEGDEDDEGDDDDDDNDDEDDDDDDDDDDDEDENPKGGKKGGPKHVGKKGGKLDFKGAAGAGGKPGEPTPSECKQT